MELAEKMNLMLTATCDDTDAFYQDYLRVKPEFADWCDISRCAFGKIDDNNLIELFFDVIGPSLGRGWLNPKQWPCSKRTTLCQPGTPSIHCSYLQADYPVVIQ